MCSLALLAYNLLDGLHDLLHSALLSSSLLSVTCTCCTQLHDCTKWQRPPRSPPSPTLLGCLQTSTEAQSSRSAPAHLSPSARSRAPLARTLAGPQDLQLPPAFALPADEAISRAIEMAYERDFSHIP